MPGMTSGAAEVAPQIKTTSVYHEAGGIKAVVHPTGSVDAKQARAYGDVPKLRPLVDDKGNVTGWERSEGKPYTAAELAQASEIVGAQEREQQRLEARKHGQANALNEVKGFFADREMNPGDVALYLQDSGIRSADGSAIARERDESEESFLDRAANAVAEDTRARLFGRWTVTVHEGQELTRSGLKNGNLLPLVGTVREHRLTEQYREVSRLVNRWRGQLQDREIASHTAGAYVEYRPYLEGGRIEAAVSPELIAREVVTRAEQLQNGLQNNPQGEFASANILQHVLYGMVNIPAAEAVKGNVQVDPNPELDKKGFNLTHIAENVLTAARGALDRTRLPQGVLPLIANGDIQINSSLEALAGLASNIPEQVHQAHLALRRIEAYAGLVSNATGGRVDIMHDLDAQLRNLTGGETDTKGQVQGGVSLTDLLEATRAISAEYTLHDSDAALGELGSIAEDISIARGRTLPRILTLPVRGGFETVRVAREGVRWIANRFRDIAGKRDDRADTTVAAPAYEPKWWNIFGEAEGREGRIKWARMQRQEQKRAERAAVELSSIAPIKREKATREKPERTKGWENATREERAAEIERRKQEKLAREQVKTENKERKTRDVQGKAELESAERDQKKAQAEKDNAGRFYDALQMEALGGANVTDGQMQAAQERLTNAENDLAAKNARLEELRRPAPVEAPPLSLDQQIEGNRGQLEQLNQQLAILEHLKDNPAVIDNYNDLVRQRDEAQVEQVRLEAEQRVAQGEAAIPVVEGAPEAPEIPLDEGQRNAIAAEAQRMAGIDNVQVRNGVASIVEDAMRQQYGEGGVAFYRATLASELARPLQQAAEEPVVEQPEEASVDIPATIAAYKNALAIVGALGPLADLQTRAGRTNRDEQRKVAAARQTIAQAQQIFQENGLGPDGNQLPPQPEAPESSEV